MQIALLITWSAICISSCSSKVESNIIIEDSSKIPTIQSRNLTVFNYNNGKMKYKFQTPLLERYDFTENPYMEFKEGIHIETFNDSTKIKEADLVADYVIYLENKKLWEAKGNVIVQDQEGKTLYTEQLFWDEAADSIYSNVDTKLVDGDETTLGDGFWSDGKFSQVIIKNSRGGMLLDTTRRVSSDTTSVENKTMQ